jgi:hypothetical protein
MDAPAQAASPTYWQAIGTIATVCGTVLTVIVTWRKDRSAISRRIQILEEATHYLAFWKLGHTPIIDIGK